MRALLTRRLMMVADRRRRIRLGLRLALCWIATVVAVHVGAAVFGAVGYGPSFGGYVGGAIGLACAVVMLIRERGRGPDLHGAAVEVERRFPELDSRLLTVVEDRSAIECEPAYCVQRLVEETLEHSYSKDWREAVPVWRLWVAQGLNLFALALAVLAVWKLGAGASGVRVPVLGGTQLEVSPGDVELERGDSLVVVVRCNGKVPGAVELVFVQLEEPEQRMSMTKGLADPIYGGTIPGVERDLAYHIEYDGRRTRDYRVKVYEHPRVERADAEVGYPEYTGLPPKRFENVRTLSAVEGSRLNLGFQLNKPVKSARLIPSRHGGEAVLLRVETNVAAASIEGMVLTSSRTYRVELRDLDGRTNKVPFELAVTVLTNQTPQIKLVRPRGDLRPSPLEEIKFAAVASDDFGVVAYGIGYAVAGREIQHVELGRNVPARERRSFEYLLSLEELKVEPDQLLSWFVWVDDIGPDGRARRTSSDLFFAEVRPFDEIFRESRTGGEQSDSEQQGQGGEQSGDDPGRLAELEKQILTATWRLQHEAGMRNEGAYRTNVQVLRDVQSDVLEQAKSALEQAFDPRMAVLWHSATTNMESAVRALDRASKDRNSLSEAVDSERSAYQALLRLNPKEYDVARQQARRGNQRQNSRQQALQRQLDQLDLARPANRYESERQAQSPLTPERREQLQALNRLRELAQRQQDLNERLRELQTALQEARNENAQNELRRQLKRLQDDQQQMVADVDELRQRMDQSDPQSNLASRQAELDQVRRDMERAADAAARGSVPQALAAGSRAQQQMQEMRDALRRETAGELGEQLREMRADARELARNQADLGRRLEQMTSRPPRTLRDPPQTGELLNGMAQQKGRLTNLVDRVTRVSDATEQSEPVVSRELYDALRSFTQADAEATKQMEQELIDRGLMTRALFDRLRSTEQNDRAKSLETAAEMLRQGYLNQAQQAEQRARAAIDTLSRGVERAAEKMLGSDTEALRFAERELEGLTGELERELAAGGAAITNAPAQTGEVSGRAGAQQDQQPRRTGERAAETVDELARALADGTDRAGDDAERADRGPITGPGFAQWSDRLREVEEMVELPWVRDELARARERARQLRREFRRDLKKPDWAVVKLEVLHPLVEVRKEIADELARRAPADRLVPIDRDPVPARYAEAVRRYYEELGK